ncbi:MAG: LytR/AlgR family response regulator transcription factor [Christensenellales bacterium]|jgi:two-component system LytT family response regulator
MLNVMIADDNDGMRLVLRKAIEKAGHKVMAEAKNGGEAVQKAEATRPDVIFMDIEMPDMDGVEAARRIQDIDPRIFLIFATAHEEYRKEAFEVYAFDYLVKPFEVKRVTETLERIENLRSGRMESAIPAPPKPQRSSKLLLRHKDGISLVDAADIILIQRENRSTVIYTPGEKHVTSETLSELEQRLPSDKFFRCHKSYIVNIERITRIYPYGRWTYIVKLKDTDLDALMTQERYVTLQDFFK